ncbi:Alpha/Beta hydrolase protein [Echria macrotheca]|uniref:Alpha/Beta hydrolase protein n=1 Tax=Echria macrotheca TaxID=438768 RepID=A0AAJ0F2L4_9PEZI|nr:Alpha/Beta hydrolase protein [Echria macrotheca]
MSVTPITESITLPHKPTASLAITYTPPSPPPGKHTTTLLLFLNGLTLPRAPWSAVLDNLLSRAIPHPATLQYDRYGQGDSPPDPSDPPNTPYGHDASTITTDLHALLTQISTTKLSLPLDKIRLVIVANSIGCALARLYAASHPGQVAGYIFLDAMMANSDFVSLIPDPDAPSFDETNLPGNVSTDDLRGARQRIAAVFHPSVGNPERFDRRNLAELLPLADGPVLPAGPDGKVPRLVVVGHDPETFAEQSEKGILSLPKAVTNAYVNPAWHAYNEGLARLVGDSSGELKIARGCGHFIQKDDPVFVADEIVRVLEAIDA